jgi:hypothetical protein
MQYITYSELKQFRASRDKGALFSNFRCTMKSFTTNGFAYSLQIWTLVRNVVLKGSACNPWMWSCRSIQGGQIWSRPCPIFTKTRAWRVFDMPETSAISEEVITCKYLAKHLHTVIFMIAY